MPALRRLLSSRPGLAAWLCAAALAMKLLVPAGFMLTTASGHVAITLCSGFAQSAPAIMPTAAMAASDMAAMDMTSMPGHDPLKEHGKTEMPCAFSGLSAQALEGVDPILLVAAIAFVMAIALRPVLRRARPVSPYLRPPLRGPPIAL